MVSYFVAHKPVLLNEVLKIFDPQPGEIYIDATVNGGGHALTILERVGPAGGVLGIDRDCVLIKALEVKCQKSNVKSLSVTCDNYANLTAIARQHNLVEVSGILFDLGFSSYHVEESRRGFSFLRSEVLDMRYNPHEKIENARDIINKWPQRAIEDVLRQYGEERFSRRIAEGITRERERKEISTTGELVKIISRSVPGWYLRGKIHPATKTFQALRIAVNQELENIEKGVGAGIEILKPGGKIAVISFHSLEDRLVKRIFRENEKSGVLGMLTKKPIMAEEREKRENPRARSAKLRAAVKI